MTQAQQELPIILTLDAVISNHMVFVLTFYKWNVSQASRALGVDRRTLYRAMQRYKLQRPLPVRSLNVEG